MLFAVSPMGKNAGRQDAIRDCPLCRQGNHSQGRQSLRGLWNSPFGGTFGGRKEEEAIRLGSAQGVVRGPIQSKVVKVVVVVSGVVQAGIRC